MMRGMIVLFALLALPSDTVGQASILRFDFSGVSGQDAADFRAMLTQCDTVAPGFTEILRTELVPFSPPTLTLGRGTAVMFAATRTVGPLRPALEFDLADLEQLPETYATAAQPWATTRCRVIAHETAEYSHYRSRFTQQYPGEDYVEYRARLQHAFNHAHAAGVSVENALRVRAGTNLRRLGRCNEVGGGTERVNIQIGQNTEVQIWAGANLTAKPTFSPGTLRCAQIGRPLVAF